MFILKTIDENGVNSKFKFDNRTCKIYDSCGSIVTPIKQLPINTFFRSNFKYKLILGRNCNFRCKYCSQHESNYIDITPSDSQIDDVIEWIINDIDLNKKDISFIEINFWGGEPTLYKNSLFYISKKIKEAVPRIKFSMITNGSLLNDPELIEHIKKYDFVITVSNDGYGQPLRTSDPFDDPTILKNLVYLHNKDSLLINPVISKFNYNINHLYDYFRDKLGVTDIKSMSTRIFSSVESLDLQKYKLTIEQRNEYRNSLLLQIIDKPQNFYLVYDKISMFIKYMNDGDYYETRYENNNFNNQEKCMTLDLFGNILYTENCFPNSESESGESFLLGNIYDGADKEPNDITCLTENMCLSCPVVFFCKFKYPCIKNSDRITDCELHVDECFAMFQATCLFATGKFITEIISPSGKIYTWNLSE